VIIFKKWRTFFGTDNEQPSFLGKLFGCMMCLPFWWGVIISLLMYSPSFAMVGDTALTIFGLEIPSSYLATFFDLFLIKQSSLLVELCAIKSLASILAHYVLCNFANINIPLKMITF
jgi:hypothetical protein